MKKYVCLLLILSMLLITSCSLGHIEDTNGPDNYMISTLTEEDIINGTNSTSIGSVHSTVNSKHTERVKKFSGVSNILNLNDSSSIKLYINFKVNSGNGIVAIVSNGIITHFFETNTNTYVTLRGGQEYIVKIVGESCNYELTLDYE